MRNNLQKIITPSILLLVVVYLTFSIAWFGVYLFGSIFDFSSTNGIIQFPFFTNFVVLYPFAGLISGVIIIINSTILQHLINKYSIIRTRTFLPAFFYLLFSLVWLPFQVQSSLHLSILTFLFLTSITVYLQMYKNKKQVEESFLSSVVLSVATLFSEELIFLLPLFWIGYFLLNCNSLKMFLASFIGFVTPWILFVAIVALTNDVFYIPFVDLMNHWDVYLYNNENFILAIFTALFYFYLLLILVQTSSNPTQDSIQTRNFLTFFRLLLIASIGLSLFRTKEIGLFTTLIILFFAIFSAHNFTLKTSKFNFIFFWLLFTSSLLLLFYFFITPYI
jgi:hypothetical protein